MTLSEHHPLGPATGSSTTKFTVVGLGIRRNTPYGLQTVGTAVGNPFSLDMTNRAKRPSRSQLPQLHLDLGLVTALITSGIVTRFKHNTETNLGKSLKHQNDSVRQR